MTSLLSGRHKYLTNKNTKKGQKLRKKLSLRERSHFLPLKTGTALSTQAKAVQHHAGSRFLTRYLLSALCIRKPHACEKARKLEKHPRNREISGVRSHDIFFGFTICIAPLKKISFFQRRINRKLTVCCLRTVLLTIYHSLRGFEVPATAIQKQQPM